MTKSLGSEILHLSLVFAVTGGFTARTQPGVTQEATSTIVNSASGGFRATDNPNTPVQGVTSNQTSLTAIVPGRSGLELVKTGDRAAAEPGDTVIYRLVLRNTGTFPASNLTVRDTLPLGLQYVTNSQRASVTAGGVTTAVSLPAPTVNGSTIAFSFPGVLAPSQTLTLVYGALLSPDAIRGTGRNLAIAQATTPSGTISSNASSHLLRIRSGILSDCGTIVGRVFVDKNFDGEQQPGESGIPNAVIFMDDGNRITTDANGLFSLQYVIAGYRTGTLDLTSLPGYTLAPNRYRIENNSQSRLVKLAPGSLGRMNFAVTPAGGGGR
ncbi:MAG: DUF11 domain-containing protein [Leptolyngbyaceae cyanobacterium CSU_1_3]|nr:DUF11 domain-containing protein [Leptolyngbyaceae cyanobacterium CSU_1_3]